MKITTDAEINALKVKEGAKVLRLTIESEHGCGLHVEVRPNGYKRFNYRARLNGKVFDCPLGRYPAISVAQARAKHGELVALVKKGIDPRQSADQAKQKKLTPTLSECYNDWLSIKKSTPISQHTLVDYQGTYTRHLEMRLGGISVGDLSQSMLIEQLTQIGTTEGARKGLVVVNQCLEHAVSVGHIEINPARLIKPAMLGISIPAPRERWLNQDELKLFWDAITEACSRGGAVADGGDGIASSVTLSVSIANCLRLMILTAVQRSDAVSMRWDQLANDQWTIPESNNELPYVVTLCPLALRIIEQQKGISKGPYVFESSINSETPIRGDSVTKALERLRSKYLAELEPFSLLDLRRSVEVGAIEYLDAPERLIELMLNRAPKRRSYRSYQVDTVDAKVRSLFLRWGEFIQTITTATE